MDNGVEIDLLHSRTPYSDATRCRKKKSSNSIKRPMNAFMCFSQWERLKIIRVDPERHNAEISKELGRRWRELSASEKRPFYERSKHLNELHKIEFPDYKYRPRKKRDHSLKLSSASDRLSVINVSESSSEAAHNNAEKNSKRNAKKIGCRGRTRMFSSSMLVQRTLGVSKPTEVLESPAVLPPTHGNLYCNVQFSSHKMTDHLVDYSTCEEITPNGEHRPHNIEIHNASLVGTNMSTAGNVDECGIVMRSRSAEQLHDSYIFKAVHNADNNQWINYDNNDNRLSANYFPLYRSYQDEQQHFYHNIRDNFVDDGNYNDRQQYMLSNGIVSNSTNHENFYQPWSHQDVPNYAVDENVDDKNTSLTCINNNFYHNNNNNNEGAVLYNDTSQAIRGSFYQQEVTNVAMEMWQDYPLTTQPTTDYHRSYSVSSASSTSRSPTSNNLHPTDEGMYLNIDHPTSHKTSLLNHVTNGGESTFDLKNVHGNCYGTNELVRHSGFYNPLIAFTNQDLNYLDV